MVNNSKRICKIYQNEQLVSFTVCMPLEAAACILFTPFFTAVYNQELLTLQTIYVLNKEILQENPQFIMACGLKALHSFWGDFYRSQTHKPKEEDTLNLESL